MESSVGAIVLAAGMSERMNGAKLVSLLQGKPMIQYVAEVASHPLIDRTVMVTGAYASAIKACMQPDRKIHVVHNDQYVKGMGTSLACGMKAMEGHVDATFIFLGDQPLIPPHVIETMIAHYNKYKQTGMNVIRPSFAGKEGHPLLVGASLFHAFFSLCSDIGGRMIIEENRDSMHVIPFSSRLWGQDIDTPEQLQWMENHSFPLQKEEMTDG